MDKTIRWKQRFQNLKSASVLFFEAAKRDDLNMLEMEGLVQRFEYTFELCWKTLKDLFESKGIYLKFPRDILKEAFQHEFINDGEVWLDMLDSRNILSHNYNKEIFLTLIKNIQKVFTPELEFLLIKLSEEDTNEK